MSEQTKFNQKEIVDEGIDLLCKKESGIQGFTSLQFSSEYALPSDQNPGETQKVRHKLVEALHSDEGLSVMLSKDDKNMEVFFKEVPSYKEVIIYIYMPDGKQIAHLSCQTKGDEDGGYVQKYYDVDDYDRYEGFGLMQIAFSLACEVIKDDPSLKTKIINGVTSEENLSSLYSRLHAPNLLEGGYYAHRIRKDTYGLDMDTYLYQKMTMEDIQKLVAPKTPFFKKIRKIFGART